MSNSRISQRLCCHYSNIVITVWYYSYAYIFNDCEVLHYKNMFDILVENIVVNLNSLRYHCLKHQLDAAAF
jgi:hypothetical protein